jgi:hypothetical protein
MFVVVVLQEASINRVEPHMFTAADLNVPNSHTLSNAGTQDNSDAEDDEDEEDEEDIAPGDDQAEIQAR